MHNKILELRPSEVAVLQNNTFVSYFIIGDLFKLGAKGKLKIVVDDSDLTSKIKIEILDKTCEDDLYRYLLQKVEGNLLKKRFFFNKYRALINKSLKRRNMIIFDTERYKAVFLLILLLFLIVYKNFSPFIIALVIFVAISAFLFSNLTKKGKAMQKIISQFKDDIPRVSAEEEFLSLLPYHIALNTYDKFINKNINFVKNYNWLIIKNLFYDNNKPTLTTAIDYMIKKLKALAHI